MSYFVLFSEGHASAKSLPKTGEYQLDVGPDLSYFTDSSQTYTAKSLDLKEFKSQGLSFLGSGIGNWLHFTLRNETDEPMETRLWYVGGYSYEKIDIYTAMPGARF